MIEHIKMMQIRYLVIWSILISGQVLHTSNSSHLFQNLKDPVLLQILSYWRKITYHQLLSLIDKYASLIEKYFYKVNIIYYIAEAVV